MARVVVQRVYATMASLSSVVLTIDGTKRGRVKSGSSETYDVPPGEHVVRAHLLWQASNPLPVFLANDHDEVVVELTTSQSPDDPADMGLLRGTIHPRSAFTLRVKR